MPKAAVLITDESTGVPRTVETDAEGRFEATNLRPGTYRVEIVTTSFKKFEQTGVVLRATRHRPRGREARARRRSPRRSRSRPRPRTTSSWRARPSSAGLDEQQLRDLPRNSRDMQSFLLLNPNVLGRRATTCSSSAAGPTASPTSRTARPPRTRSSARVGNSAPGLDAIAEMQVLSNSYSAEYGGLAGVVVTTKRGGNALPGHGLLRLQLRRPERPHLRPEVGCPGGRRCGDPNADTHQHRWGASASAGRSVTNKTFFFANYEGSNDKAIYGGGTGRPSRPRRCAPATSRARRFTIKDPLTGLPFPGNVIPASRLDPSAQKIMNFFYPLPNQGTLVDRLRRLPAVRARDAQPPARGPADRPRAELEGLALPPRRATSTATRAAITLRGAATRSPTCRSWSATLDTAAVVGGWTKIFSTTVVNEFRVGYNYDNSRAAEQLRRSRTSTPSSASRRRPASSARAASASRPSASRAARTGPSNIAGRRPQRRPDHQPELLLDQQQPDLRHRQPLAPRPAASGTATWRVTASASASTTAASTGSTARRPGNAFADFLLGNVSRPCARPRTPRAAPLDGHSDDFALFAQDDWRVSNDLTVFLGLRYELVGHVAREERHARQLHARRRRPPRRPERRGGEPAAARPAGPGPDAHRRPRPACPTRSSTPTRTTSARASASPGGSAATTRPCSAAASASSTPRSPCRACATCWPRTSSATPGLPRRQPLAARLLAAATPFVDPADFGNQGIDPNLQSPGHLPVQPDPRARARRRHRRAGQLHRLDDAEAPRRHATTTRCRPAPSSSTPTTPTTYARLPFPPTAPTWTSSRTRARASSTRSRSSCTRRWKERPGVQRRLHLRPLRQQRPRLGQQHASGVVQLRPLRHREATAGPTRTW